MGDVSIGTLLYELNVVVFTGSEHNELYNNKKLVVYDLSKHKEIYYTLFQNAITDIKAISKFIFVTSLLLHPTSESDVSRTNPPIVIFFILFPP